MKDIKIVNFVCDLNECSSNSFKIIKIVEWSSYQNITKMWVFIKIYVYYYIWVLNFTFIIKSIYRLFWSKEFFVWEHKQQNFMNSLKLTLTNVFTMIFLNYEKNAKEIILTININFCEWDKILMQIINEKRHFFRYESDIWSE